jgi:hypothetical protein
MFNESRRLKVFLSFCAFIALNIKGLIKSFIIYTVKKIGKINFNFFFETGSPSVAQASLKLVMFLHQTPECWDYRGKPPCLALRSKRTVWEGFEPFGKKFSKE